MVLEPQFRDADGTWVADYVRLIRGNPKLATDTVFWNKTTRHCSCLTAKAELFA